MLRGIWIAALLGILCMALYLPSITPADRYLDVIRSDDAAVRALWGGDSANRILARMLELHRPQAGLSSPPPKEVRSGVDAAVATTVAQVNERLFGNPYFRAIDAQLALATYRASLLMESWALVAVLLVVAGIDGLVLREVRARELVPHWAELFTLSLAIAIGLGGALAMWCFVPRTVEPTYAQLVLIALPLMLGRAVANYHSIR